MNWNTAEFNKTITTTKSLSSFCLPSNKLFRSPTCTTINKNTIQSPDSNLSMKNLALGFKFFHDQKNLSDVLNTIKTTREYSKEDFQKLERNIDLVKDLFMQRKFAEAVEICNKLLKEQNWSPHFLLARAESLERLQQFDKALADYTLLTELIPRHIPSFLGIARCYRGKGNYVEAMKFLNLIVNYDITVTSFSTFFFFKSFFFFFLLC